MPRSTSDFDDKTKRYQKANRLSDRRYTARRPLPPNGSSRSTSPIRCSSFSGFFGRRSQERAEGQAPPSSHKLSRPQRGTEISASCSCPYSCPCSCSCSYSFSTSTFTSSSPATSVAGSETLADTKLSRVAFACASFSARFAFATLIMSFMRLSWFTSEAPGS